MKRPAASNSCTSEFSTIAGPIDSSFVFAVLVLLFHDFMQPVTILAALPLSLGGAFGALAIFGHGLSMPSLVGLVSPESRQATLVEAYFDPV